MHKLESFVMIAVPAAFWIGLIYGFLISNFTSNPHFLGSRAASAAFSIVAVLFAANTSHALLRRPFLFGTPLVEYPIIAAAMAAIHFWIHRRREAGIEASLASDKGVSKCPKCGSYVKKIMAECPKCETRLA